MNKLIAIFSLLIVGCAPSLPKYQHVDKDIKVAVQYFTLDQKNVKYNGNVNFTRQVAENIAAILQENGITAVAIPVDSNIDSKYIINGDISKLDEGVWSLRFWIGFGAGSAKFEASARFIDASSQNVISTCKQERISTSYLGSDQILHRVCLEVSEDICKAFKTYISN